VGAGIVSRVELFALIRRDARVEGFSVRALAERHGVHRRTVRKAFGSAVPPPRKTPVRSSPVTGPLRQFFFSSSASITMMPLGPRTYVSL
jgi:hypothetical protein